MGSGCRHMSTRWRFLFFFGVARSDKQEILECDPWVQQCEENSVQVIPDTERERERRERDARECFEQICSSGGWHLARHEDVAIEL